MADDQNVVKQIVWSEIFSFPQIFKSFKMATQPHVLALGFVALVLLFAGGMVLDKIWTISDSGTAVNGEILLHVGLSPDDFDNKIEQWEDSRLGRAAGLLSSTKNERRSISAWGSLAGRSSRHLGQALGKRNEEYIKKNQSGDDFASISSSKIIDLADKNDEDWDDLIDQAEEAHEEELDKIAFLLDDIKKEAKDLIKNDNSLKDDDKKEQKKNTDKAMENLELALIDASRGVTLRKLKFQQDVKAIEGDGIFESFITFQRDCIYHAIMQVRYLNFTGGLAEYQKVVKGRSAQTVSLEATSGMPDVATMAPKDDPCGVLFYILMSAESVRWLIAQNWIFATIFLIWALLLWALFGGAMYRMAAIRFAREEKISAFQALQFSKQKFFSFFSVPLVPIVVILGAGLLLALGGLIGSIPAVGSILLGVFFGIAILIGVGIAFMTIGLVAGGPLYYPSIAIEGSDCLDAFSRSFTYVFSRPFRAILYGVIASIYGMLTYLFVRLFAFIALSAVHCFVKAGIWGGGGSMGTNADKLDVLWQKPTFWNLHQFNWTAMTGWDKIWAIVMAVWIVILVGLVAAYILSYFVSASTTCYYILRRRVDATDLDEVYIEEEVEPAAPEAVEETPADTEKPAEKEDDAK